MIDFNVVNVILAGFGGLTVLGITEVLKRFLKVSGFFAVLISLIVSAGFTLYYFLMAGFPGVLQYLAYTLVVFLTANGIFKATHGGS